MDGVEFWEENDRLLRRKKWRDFFKVDWFLCHLLDRHEYSYHYRDVGGCRQWPDGAFSLGPEHVGWICNRCDKFDRRNSPKL